MKDNLNTEKLKEAARETHRRLQDELDRKIDEAEELKSQMQVTEATQELLDEIQEEMRWDIYVGRKIAEFDYDYPDFTTHLAAYLCRCDDEDTFLLLEHLDYKWLKRDELDQLEWTGADLKLLEYL